MEEKIDVVRMIGTLDRCISEMMVMAKHRHLYDEADLQTLKHHAEDCVSAGNKIKEMLVTEPKFVGLKLGSPALKSQIRKNMEEK